MHNELLVYVDETDTWHASVLPLWPILRIYSHCYDQTLILEYLLVWKFYFTPAALNDWGQSG